jgi:hypothetical protein
MISATGRISLMPPTVCADNHYRRGRRVEAGATVEARGAECCPSSDWCREMRHVGHPGAPAPQLADPRSSRNIWRARPSTIFVTAPYRRYGAEPTFRCCLWDDASAPKAAVDHGVVTATSRATGGFAERQIPGQESQDELKANGA